MVKLLETVKQYYQPSHWTYMSPETEMELVLVSKGSTEYRRVVDGIQQTLSLAVDRIERIQNPYLWGCYLLKKAEYECHSINFCEKTLYHETQKCNVDSIARNNFNWRLSGRRAKYGEGVSFSYSASYAHRYSSYGGVMLVAHVLVGKTEYGCWHEEIPSEGNDTTTSDGGSDCCNVYVKFSDHEFYPEYIVYFD